MLTPAPLPGMDVRMSSKGPAISRVVQTPARAIMRWACLWPNTVRICVCISMMPGIKTFPEASMSFFAGREISSLTAAIFPSETARSLIALTLLRGSTTSAPRMIKSNILNFLLGLNFGVACLRLYEQQGLLNIETNLQDFENTFLVFS